jgi:hypothetical protein
LPNQFALNQANQDACEIVIAVVFFRCLNKASGCDLNVSLAGQKRRDLFIRNYSRDAITHQEKHVAGLDGPLLQLPAHSIPRVVRVKQN